MTWKGDELESLFESPLPPLTHLLTESTEDRHAGTGEKEQNRKWGKTQDIRAVGAERE